MTTLFLVRHGLTAQTGHVLYGRTPGIPLDHRGAAQAAELVRRFEGIRVTAIYSSPLERTRETAAPLAAALRLDVRLCPEAVELDFGEWVGQQIAGLGADPRWRAFNSFRSLSPAPGGELMLDVQTRIVAGLAQIRAAHPGEAIAVFSHGDVIRSAVAYFAGVPLDLFLRIEIRPASVSSVRFYDDSLHILGINDTGDLYA